MCTRNGVHVTVSSVSFEFDKFNKSYIIYTIESVFATIASILAALTICWALVNDPAEDTSNGGSSSGPDLSIFAGVLLLPLVLLALAAVLALIPVLGALALLAVAVFLLGVILRALWRGVRRGWSSMRERRPTEENSSASFLRRTLQKGKSSLRALLRTGARGARCALRVVRRMSATALRSGSSAATRVRRGLGVVLRRVRSARIARKAGADEMSEANEERRSDAASQRNRDEATGWRTMLFAAGRRRQTREAQEHSVAASAQRRELRVEHVHASRLRGFLRVRMRRQKSAVHSAEVRRRHAVGRQDAPAESPLQSHSEARHGRTRRRVSRFAAWLLGRTRNDTHAASDTVATRAASGVVLPRTQARFAGHRTPVDVMAMLRRIGWSTRARMHWLDRS